MSGPSWMAIPQIERLEKPPGCPVADRSGIRGFVLWSWKPKSEHVGDVEICVTSPQPAHISRRKGTELYIDLDEPVGFIIAFRLATHLVNPASWTAEFNRVWYKMHGQSDGYEIVAKKILGENPGQFRPSDRYALAVALSNVITVVDRLSSSSG